jgi:transcriptional regulator with XRE-family HTH domain
MPQDVFDGQALRRARRHRLWTQADLADMAGVTERTVLELEMGHRDPLRRTVDSLAAALKVPVESLLRPPKKK